MSCRSGRRIVLVSVFVSVSLALLSGFSTPRAYAGEPTSERNAARGAALLAPFKTELQQALLGGLKKGPIEAIGVCRLRAPEIARDLSRDGVRVGRTSHRLRNPANASPDWVKPTLDQFVADPTTAGPRLHSLPEGRVGYVEPIRMQPLCVTCHGELIAPALAARIETLYPEDRAVGFRVGDLRGLFWAEMPSARASEDNE